jgi:hypothetical protein
VSKRACPGCRMMDGEHTDDSRYECSLNDCLWCIKGYTIAGVMCRICNGTGKKGPSDAEE